MGRSIYSVNAILLGFLLLLVVPVAAEFSVSYRVQDSTINANERAEYVLTVTNFGTDQDMYQVYSNDPRFLVSTDPDTLAIAPGETLEILVFADPTASSEVVGTYEVPLVIRSSDRTEQQRSLPLIIRSADQSLFSPSIVIDVEVNNELGVDPREEFPLDFRIVNRNRLNITNLTVSYTSTFCNGGFISQIPPNGELVKAEMCSVPELTVPQKDTLEVVVHVNGELVGDVTAIPFDIVSIIEPFTITKQTEEFFLRSSLAMQIENTANVAQEQSFTVPRNALEKAFSVITMNGDVNVEDAAEGYKFVVALTPGQQADFSVETNLRGLFFTVVIVIAVVVVSIILYFLLRSPVVVKRQMTQIGNAEGEVTRAKILLHVKNRTGKVLEKATIVETVPSIAEVSNTFDVGTLKPTKVVHHHTKGTLLRWDFSTLEPYEERIVSYRIASKLSIVGRVNLPPTRIKYSTDGGKTFKTVRFTHKEGE